MESIRAKNFCPKGSEVGVGYRKILPSEIRKLLYERALVLHQDYNLSCTLVVQHLSNEFNLDVPYPTVWQWLNRNRKPDGRCRPFLPQPSPDLSRVIGEVLGDGNLRKPIRWRNNLLRGRIRFAVIDKELAEDFATRAARLLGREPYRLYLRDKKRANPRYEVPVASIKLWLFLKQPLEKLKPYIEPYSAEFLSSVFDTEGGPTVSMNRRGKTFRLQLQVILSNTNEELMMYVKELLNHLGIHCEICKRPPRNTTYITDDESRREIRPAKTSWQLGIYRRDSLKVFAEKVGFFLKRKQEKLDDALRLMKTYGPKKAADMWPTLYEKRGALWVRKPKPSFLAY